MKKPANPRMSPAVVLFLICLSRTEGAQPPRCTRYKDIHTPMGQDRQNEYIPPLSQHVDNPITAPGVVPEVTLT